MEVDPRYDRSYTDRMKTAISLPDELFARAELTARRLGLARSQLFARAVEEFIREHDPQVVTDAIDKVVGDADICMDPVIAKMQSISVAPDQSDEAW